MIGTTKAPFRPPSSSTSKSIINPPSRPPVNRQTRTHKRLRSSIFNSTPLSQQIENLIEVAIISPDVPIDTISSDGLTHMCYKNYGKPKSSTDSSPQISQQNRATKYVQSRSLPRVFRVVDQKLMQTYKTEDISLPLIAIFFTPTSIAAIDGIDPHTLDLLVRRCLSQTDEAETTQFKEWFSTTNERLLKQYLEVAENILTDHYFQKKAKKTKLKIARRAAVDQTEKNFSYGVDPPVTLDFKINSTCPIHTKISSTITFQNSTAQKLYFKIKVPSSSAYSASVKPSAGVVRKGTAEKVTFSIILNSSTPVADILEISIADFPKKFIRFDLTPSKSVFGESLQSVKFCKDEIDGTEYLVPDILIQLRKALLSRNGLDHPNIFSSNGDKTVIATLKEAVDKGDFSILISHKDKCSVAAILKMWLRDLSVGLLNAFPPDMFKTATINGNKYCVDLLTKLVEPNKTVMDWLLAFSAQILSHSDSNKLSDHSLAVSLGANLFRLTDGFSPQEGVLVTQSVIQFFKALIQHEVG